MYSKPNYIDSRQKEIDGLLKNRVFEFVNLEDVLANVRVFKLRFVNGLKNRGTKNAFKKSRLIIYAYND